MNSQLGNGEHDVEEYEVDSSEINNRTDPIYSIKPDFITQW